MNAETFVKHWKDEKDYLLKLYTSDDEKSAVSEKIKKLNLNSKQKKILNDLLNDMLNDTFITFLLGLDGVANIGNGMQENFKIFDEEGKLIAERGEIEEKVYQYFPRT